MADLRLFDGKRDANWKSTVSNEYVQQKDNERTLTSSCDTTYTTTDLLDDPGSIATV